MSSRRRTPTPSCSGRSAAAVPLVRLGATGGTVLGVAGERPLPVDDLARALRGLGCPAYMTGAGVMPKWRIDACARSGRYCSVTLRKLRHGWRRGQVRRAMAMAASDIERLIRARIPDAEVTIRDLAGDGDHYAATVIAESFRGKSRVQQHQIVYEALKAEMGGKLHALALQTGTPER